MGAETRTDAISLEHQQLVFDAAAEALSSTCGVTLDPQEEVGAFTPVAFVAVISLVGDVEWTVSLRFLEGTAVGLAGAFAGFEIPADDPDMGDALGELANIVGGRAKARLDQHGIRGDISLPSVMRGDDISVLNYRDLPAVRRRFSTESGPLLVEIVAAGAADG